MHGAPCAGHRSGLPPATKAKPELEVHHTARHHNGWHQPSPGAIGPWIPFHADLHAHRQGVAVPLLSPHSDMASTFATHAPILIFIPLISHLEPPQAPNVVIPSNATQPARIPSGFHTTITPVSSGYHPSIIRVLNEK
jgi:hypothetical protein